MTSPELKLVPTDLIDPHPDNPRVVLREDVVGAIVANLNGEYPQKHAVHVRPAGDRYQLIAGHQRTEAARRKGLPAVWAWVEDMDDPTAFMELVTSNNQGELSPLEIGIHALKAVPKAEGGRGKKGGLSAYAEKVGKSQDAISMYRRAAEVASNLRDISEVYLGLTYQLEAIHALPRECWADACGWLAQNADATVKDVEAQVEKAKEYAHQTPVARDSVYLPLHRCTAAVFAGTDPSHFYALHALAEKVAGELAGHPDLSDQWRAWLEENAGGESWDRRAVHAKRAELEDVLLERERVESEDECDHDVRHGDFREVAKTLADGSVDLVFTDPPYHREYLPLYGDLAREAARVLKPGGSLICYLGQYQIHEVCNLVTPHLRLWWTLCCLHSGQSARMTEYGVVVKWKPMLWFVKGTRGDKHTFVDDLVLSNQEKDAHEWQQGEAEATYFIDKLTLPGGFVFDPFCGGGTTAAAAKKLRRRWLTCDTDPESVAVARKRVADAR